MVWNQQPSTLCRSTCFCFPACSVALVWLSLQTEYNLAGISNKKNIIMIYNVLLCFFFISFDVPNSLSGFVERFLGEPLTLGRLSCCNPTLKSPVVFICTRGNSYLK